MMYPPTTTPAGTLNDEDRETDYASIKSPTRKSFLIRQTLEFIFFMCITVCVLIFFFIYVVVITLTMLPLAIVTRRWHNISAWYLAPAHLQSHIYAYYRKASKRLASEWDVEKAKPLPLARLRRGFESQELISSPQIQLGLIARLPPELRLQIYREIIIGDSTHVHIAVHRIQKPGRKQPRSRTHGHFCSSHSIKDPIYDCKCFDVGSCGPTIPRCQAPAPENSGRGILALSKTNKQLYAETINLHYNLPTFYFNSLSKPPFFLQSLLPQRLAQIKHIQLCYNSKSMTNTCLPETRHLPKFQRRHNLQLCNSCNLNSWLDTIRKTMTALQSIQTFIYLDKHARVPQLDDAWMGKLFRLQWGTNGLRELKVQIFFDKPNRPALHPLVAGWMNPPLLPAPAPPQVPAIEKLDEALQDRIRRGAVSRISSAAFEGGGLTAMNCGI